MSNSSRKLEQYSKKRDPERTPEPGDTEIDFKWAEGRPIFVIQKHDASSLHYDFRLEVNGVLKSWAIPKGPSTDPGEKRLAIPTEDHPLAYADFEGVIPQGEYGGGSVMVWDRGSYSNNKDTSDRSRPDISRQLRDGHVTVWLQGKKIYGGYALIRTGSGSDARWLLVKMNDEKADARRNPVSTEPQSVKSGMSMKEIAEKGPVLHKND